MSNRLVFLEIDFQELFDDLHKSGLWPDGKTISDAVTLDAPAVVLDHYREEKKGKNFDIKDFFYRHFDEAPTLAHTYESDSSLPIEEHIQNLWPILSRDPEESDFYSTLIPLPYPYVVPGGRFNEIYYWDSYFTMLGLLESNETQMVQHMIDNFEHMIQKFGFIPNGNRTYYLGRSQPPFFSLMVKLLVEHLNINDKEAGKQALLRYGDAMEKEYQFWMTGSEKCTEEQAAHKRVVRMPNGTFLNRYFDNAARPRAEMYRDDRELTESLGEKGQETLLNIRAACESGWDFSSRWCKDPMDLSTIRTTEIIPVDLNCLLYHLEEMIAKYYSIDNQEEKANAYRVKYVDRRLAMDTYFWNETTKYYHDYLFTEQKNTDSIHAAGLFPMFFKLCRPKQVVGCAQMVEKELLAEGGLLTTHINSGQQWDAPNGWAPLQYIAITALQHYREIKIARLILERWIKLNLKVFRNTGKLMEKYNVEDTSLLSGGGEYPVQDGFGWTNGVLLKLIKDNGRVYRKILRQNNLA